MLGFEWGIVTGLRGEEDKGTGFRQHGKIIWELKAYLFSIEIWKMKLEIS